MTASREEIQRVPGIGEKIAQSIRGLLEADAPSCIGRADMDRG